MNRRLVRWNGVLTGPPEIHLRPGRPEPLHRKLPQRLAAAPLGELVERTLLAVGGQPWQRLVEVLLGKSISVTVAVLSSARSMKLGDETSRCRLTCASLSVSARIG